MIKIILGIGILLLIGLLIYWKKKNQIQEINKQYNWKTQKENFKTDFLKILADKPDLKYFVIDFNDYYIQFMRFDESQEFYCESVSNEFLTEQAKLNQEQIDKILEIYFRKPNEKDTEGNSSPNYSKFYKADKNSDLIEIYNELIYLMTVIYGIGNDEIIKVRFD